MSNFDQFFVGLPITLPSLPQLLVLLAAIDLRRKELHMGILDELLGGGQRQKEYRDFVN